MSFIIRRKSDGKFAEGRTRYSASFVANINYARVFTERGHAVNSMRHTFAVLGNRGAKATHEAMADLEVMEVCIVPSDHLQSLEDDALKLSCLEQGGVDNWEWYYESLKEHGYFEGKDA